MVSESRLPSLDIDQDLAYQERSWKVQRVGWVVMALVVLAAAIGILGGGGLARGEVKNGNLAIEYDRLIRCEAPAVLVVHVNAPSAGPLRVWIDADYTKALRIEHIVPEPSTVSSGPDRLVLRFEVDSDTQPIVISFHYTPREAGTVQARIGLEDGPTASFRQFVYP